MSKQQPSRIRWASAAWLALGLCFLLLSCSPKRTSTDAETDPQAAQRVRVLSSFSIVTNMIEEIGQDRVEVHNLVPVGTDPHEYSPRPNDVKFATRADLLIYNGLNLEGGSEGWLSKLADTASPKDMPRIAAAEKVKPLYISDDTGRKEVNPHAFINPQVGIQMAERIRDALIDVDPAHAEHYRAHAESYLQALREVETRYKTTFADIPSAQRVLMTSEQAFQYLARAYDLREGYIWAIDTDKNGTPAQIKAAIAFVKEHKPPVLFVESNVDRRPMETVSDATGVPIHATPIFSDELGKPGQPADTYIGYLEYNLTQLRAGLQGD